MCSERPLRRMPNDATYALGEAGLTDQSQEVLGHEHLAIMMRLYAAMERGKPGMTATALGEESSRLWSAAKLEGLLDIVVRSGYAQSKRHGNDTLFWLHKDGIRVARQTFDIWDESEPRIRLDRSKVTLRDVVGQFTVPPKWGVRGKRKLLLKWQWMFRRKWI